MKTFRFTHRIVSTYVRTLMVQADDQQQAQIKAETGPISHILQKEGVEQAGTTKLEQTGEVICEGEDDADAPYLIDCGQEPEEMLKNEWTAIYNGWWYERQSHQWIRGALV